MTLSLKEIIIESPNGNILLGPLNIEVLPREITTLMGPSGCGKSTLLDLIAGHLSREFKYSGHIELCGKTLCDLPAHKRQVGILFQDDLLFPHLNIWQNLAFAIPNEVKGDAREELALSTLDSLGLSNLTDSFPDQISGGQRARISLSRMLLAKPKLALLDEPYSKLDQELREQFRFWVEEQIRMANIPALMVTHDKADIPAGGLCLTWPWEATHA
jgi:putative thiamine transport system ATP-binding protein